VSLCIVSANAATTPVDASKWETRTPVTDHAYSFVFVGDTQCITYDSDYLKGTKYLNQLFQWIVDNKDTKKIAHTFILGDITDRTYQNDPSISANQIGATGDAEWKIAKEAISKLDGKVSYSIARGNHDSYEIDAWLGHATYRSQFNGFYDGSADVYSEMTNSYMLKEISGTKYLFMAIDFNPHQDVINWANKIISQHPDYKVIITTHSYLDSDGSLTTNAKDGGSYKYYNGVDAEYLWNNLVSKHENIIMVASGHVGVDPV
jgi:hypothetical protein